MKKNTILLFVLLVVNSCGLHSKRREAGDTASVKAGEMAAAPRGSDSITPGNSGDSMKMVQIGGGEAGIVRKLIDSFTVDLNGDSIPDTIRLYSSRKGTTSFDGIRVTLAGYEEKYFTTTYPWTMISKWFEDSGINELPTDKLLVSKWKGQSVILLFGTPDEVGDESNFCIVNIEHNQVRLVLEQLKRHIDVEVPMRLFDMDGDGRPEFLYTQMYECVSSAEEEKKLGGKICAYSPYYIYTVDDSCVLNKKQTIRYNKENYVFAGFKYSEKIMIFNPDDTSKRPRVWKK
jgi:hypothetical protein